MITIREVVETVPVLPPRKSGRVKTEYLQHGPKENPFPVLEEERKARCRMDRDVERRLRATGTSEKEAGILSP